MADPQKSTFEKVLDHVVIGGGAAYIIYLVVATNGWAPAIVIVIMGVYWEITERRKK